MKKSFLNLLIITIVIVFFIQNSAVSADEITKIKQAIKDKGASWTASENWVTRLTKEERKNLCGEILEPPDPSKAVLLSLPLIDDLPTEFDWRDNNGGNWVTPVKNQSYPQSCGSCWDFSAVGQVEAWWKVYNANLDSMIDLSEQFVLSCTAGSCNGWSTALALDFIQSVGVPSEACFPYEADDTIPCDSACIYWEEEALRIPGWGYITLEEDIIDNIKNAVYRHPVSASFTVYTDFFYYSGDVYEYVWGEVEGGHAIVIVGWNDAEQSWICKNSWGAGWGNSGYFRIKWSECGMGSYMPFIWDSMTGGQALAVTPGQLDLSLTAGDSTTETITLKNLGPDVVEFSSIDYEKPVKFHPDNFIMGGDMYWWCGDLQIGGYGDHWLQYLDTPVLDLSNTTEPHLTWMGYWAVEDPAGASKPYDGWDGCNVWVSVNGGQNYNVASPVSPNYNCQSLWSFGDSKEGWNMGAGIAGWAGTNGDWTEVDFDLSSYKSDNVIIRFAFASDMGLCTIDDPSLYGFFIDDIKIADGAEVIFENNGENINTMTRIGHGFGQADWINIPNGLGVIQSGDSALIDININTSNLDPDNYSGMIKITSNDTTGSVIEVPLNLELSEPVNIKGLAEINPGKWNLAQNYPNPFNPVTTLSYQIPKAAKVTLSIYNIRGQLVKTLVNKNQIAGSYSIIWNANGLSSGIYFYKIKAEDFTEIKKCLIVK
jgi:C1A family cysteine protease